MALEGSRDTTSKELFKKGISKSAGEGLESPVVNEHKTKYAAEPWEQYGDIAVEAERWTSKYTKEDWTTITAEREATNAKIIYAHL